MTGTPSLRVAVLGSGKGSNCQAILDAAQNGSLNAKVVCVISDVEDALILQRARDAGVPALYISGAPFRTKLEGDAEKRYLDALCRFEANLVALAGFMRIVKGGLLKAFRNRILNIHPALLPAFPGVESWKQALDYGAKVSGCTVHLVDEGTDTGPILVQRTVPILDQDTPNALHTRIQAEEYKAYPEALSLFVRGRPSLVGRRVVFSRIG